MRLGLAGGVILGTSLLGGAVHAEPFAERKKGDVVTICIEAFEKGQVSRKRGRFREAVDAFEACASARCPDAVRKDCLQHLDAAHAAAPRVVLVVRDARGAELDVAIELDGRPASRQAFEVDVGDHVATYSVKGQAITHRFTVREDDKSRVVVLPDAPPPSASSPPASNEEEGRSSIHTIGPVIAGVAGLGFVVFGVGSYLGYTTRESKLQKDFDAACIPANDPNRDPRNCTDPELADQRQRKADYEANESDAMGSFPLWFGAIALGTLLIAGGVTWFILAPSGKTKPAATGVLPIVGPRRADLVVRF